MIIKHKITGEVIFEGAFLTGAKLVGADLTEADLTRADLVGADLTGANLTGANLEGAYLRQANLTGANLTGADLEGAYPTYEQLASANTSGIKEDFFKILAASPDEVGYLRAALVEGRVNGTVYEGECACLVGTLAKAKGVSYHLLSPNVDRPAETWFLAIDEGHTPDNSPMSRLTVEWVDEFLNNNEGN